MKLDEARTIAQNFVLGIFDHVEVVEIVGSIRRQKPEVNDIDLVVIPKESFWTKVKEFNLKRSGKKIIELDLNGIQVDIYIATKENFEVLRLIRTGSAEHNIKLCMEARKKGWKMYANGQGLETNNGWVVGEEAILKELCGKYIEPQNREVNA